ncbi:MAG: YcaO-like family protein [Lachnospiraceae bacterium]|nr:YcaO-like family protein [Lachnospiraceae bacterium]
MNAASLTGEDEGMAVVDYNKYKDQRPEDTIWRIQSILHEAGLATVCKWTENEYEGCYSNRVTIYPTALGTNGKGTDRLYAMASGYGELMERIQNALLYAGSVAPEDRYYGGFEEYPDEKMVPLDELVVQRDPFTEHFFRTLGCEHDDEKKKALEDYLSVWNNFREMRVEETPCIPFACPAEKRIVYLPISLIINIYGSNGMAAGNTREEALVQGLAEIFERYVNSKIALEHICPPSVPREMLAQIPSLYRIICEIEKDPAYRVDIKDCSLGRGLPVAAIIIYNRNTGNFGVKFASHPSFSVALERTLTEAFQGKNLERFSNTNRVGSDALVRHRDNISNFMKIGNGCYPKEFLSEQPDYAFEPELFLPRKSNTEMLTYMLDLVRGEGYRALIHDASYLGFPSYFIIVPGMSEVFPIDWARCRENTTLKHVEESFAHLRALTEAEADRIILYMNYKKNALLENKLSWIFMRPLTDRIPGGNMSTTLMKAMLLYQRGRYGEAVMEMNKVSEYFERKQMKEALFYKCCSSYMHLRADGAEADACDMLIRKLFPEETAARVSAILADEKTAVSRMYPEPKCYDCEHCEMGEKKYCEYRQTIAVLNKIKDAMKKNIPDQEELLEELLHR